MADAHHVGEHPILIESKSTSANAIALAIFFTTIFACAVLLSLDESVIDDMFLFPQSTNANNADELHQSVGPSASPVVGMSAPTVGFLLIKLPSLRIY
jgi:hypothetical protein